MVKINNRANAGLTLVEMLVVLSIFTVISGLLIVILFNSSGVQYRESFKISQGVGSNEALAKIRGNIKSSQQVAIGYPEVDPIYTTGANILVLKLASVDQTDTIVDGSYDYFVYLVEENSLQEKVFPSVASQRKLTNLSIARGVDTLIFHYLDTAGEQMTPQAALKVRVILKLAQDVGQNSQVSIATSEAYLRNY